jgi:hypothetical protein
MAIEAPKINVDVIDYYDTAEKFVRLNVMAKMLIGEHFKVEDIDYSTSESLLEERIFLSVIKKNKFDEFKGLISKYRAEDENEQSSFNRQ